MIRISQGASTLEEEPPPVERTHNFSHIMKALVRRAHGRDALDTPDVSSDSSSGSGGTSPLVTPPPGRAGRPDSGGAVSTTTAGGATQAARSSSRVVLVPASSVPAEGVTLVEARDVPPVPVRLRSRSPGVDPPPSVRGERYPGPYPPQGCRYREAEGARGPRGFLEEAQLRSMHIL